jgi:ATP synthase protein I
VVRHYGARRSGRGGRNRSVLRFPEMSESEPPDPLARLGKRLDEARARHVDHTADADGPATQQGVAVGLRIGIELVVSVVVATALGWAIDRWLGTGPWATIVLFFLGVAAGMLSVYRAITGVKMAVGYRRLDTADAGRPPAMPKGRARDKWDDED